MVRGGVIGASQHGVGVIMGWGDCHLRCAILGFAPRLGRGHVRLIVVRVGALPGLCLCFGSRQELGGGAGGLVGDAIPGMHYAVDRVLAWGRRRAQEGRGMIKLGITVEVWLELFVRDAVGGELVVDFLSNDCVSPSSPTLDARYCQLRRRNAESGRIGNADSHSRQTQTEYKSRPQAPCFGRISSYVSFCSVFLFG